MCACPAFSEDLRQEVKAWTQTWACLEPLGALGVPIGHEGGGAADDDALGHGRAAQLLMPALQQRPQQGDALQCLPVPRAAWPHHPSSLRGLAAVVVCDKIASTMHCRGIQGALICGRQMQHIMSLWLWCSEPCTICMEAAAGVRQGESHLLTPGPCRQLGCTPAPHTGAGLQRTRT